MYVPLVIVWNNSTSIMICKYSKRNSTPSNFVLYIKIIKKTSLTIVSKNKTKNKKQKNKKNKNKNKKTKKWSLSRPNPLLTEVLVRFRKVFHLNWFKSTEHVYKRDLIQKMSGLHWFLDHPEFGFDRFCCISIQKLSTSPHKIQTLPMVK